MWPFSMNTTALTCFPAPCEQMSYRPSLCHRGKKSGMSFKHWCLHRDVKLRSKAPLLSVMIPALLWDGWPTQRSWHQAGLKHIPAAWVCLYKAMSSINRSSPLRSLILYSKWTCCLVLSLTVALLHPLVYCALADRYSFYCPLLLQWCQVDFHLFC